MTAPFRFAGKGRSPPGSTGKVGPCGFREKSSSPVLRYFPRKTLPVEAACTTAPETGNGIPIKHEDYESERKNQENSRQQVGKDGSIGPHSRHRVQLALFARHIPRMDSRGHRVFQGTVQVPLPDSLYSRGVRHHPVHPEFSGLLKSDPGTAPPTDTDLHDNGSDRLRLPRFFISDGNFLPTAIPAKGYSSFFLAKIAFCPVMCKAALTGWLAGKKSSSRRSGIFSRQALPLTGQKPDRGK